MTWHPFFRAVSLDCGDADEDVENIRVHQRRDYMLVFASERSVHKLPVRIHLIQC